MIAPTPATPPLFSVAYGYDSLNRLTGVTGPVNKTMCYDSQSLGNIIYKSDIVAGATTGSCPASGNGLYTYPTAGSARPHAVSGISGLGGFTYDADGNMLTGNGRTTSWTSFNQPLSITQNGKTVSYAYGPEHQRVAQWTAAIDKVYLATGEVLAPPGASSMQGRTYVMNPAGERVGDMFLSPVSGWNTNNTPAFSFYFNDWQNSVSAITDAVGNLLEMDSYDAWGKRRNNNGLDDTTNSITSRIVRGYTNQEEVQDVELIDLNARMYDPFIGKMLSVDPAVADWSDPQAWNAYAYARNNPLRYTDPTGMMGEGEGDGLDDGDDVLPRHISPAMAAEIEMKAKSAPAPYLVHTDVDPHPETDLQTPPSQPSASGPRMVQQQQQQQQGNGSYKITF